MKKNNGITLIALIITIIVMLILVVVSIQIALNTGLFESAGKATGDWKGAQDKEGELSSGKVTIGNKTYGDVDKYINEINPPIVEPEDISEWVYEIQEDETVMITGYKGSDTKVTIPNYINGKPVKKITGSMWNSLWTNEICTGNKLNGLGVGYVNKQNTITSVIVSEGIETIGSFTFTGSLALENIVLPESLKEIEGCAFSACDNLKEITIPEGVSEVGANLFYLSSEDFIATVSWKQGQKPEGWDDNWDVCVGNPMLTEEKERIQVKYAE